MLFTRTVKRSQGCAKRSQSNLLYKIIDVSKFIRVPVCLHYYASLTKRCYLSCSVILFVFLSVFFSFFLVFCVFVVRRIRNNFMQWNCVVESPYVIFRPRHDCRSRARMRFLFCLFKLLIIPFARKWLSNCLWFISCTIMTDNRLIITFDRKNDCNRQKKN